MQFPVDRFRSLPTPFYFYDVRLLRDTLHALVEAASIDSRFRVHYAVKANHRAQLLSLISSYGLGADCVSGNEIRAAVEAGFPSRKIVFAGVGKTDEEINTALDLRIGNFNVESEQELTVISDLAVRKGLVADVTLRVNPEIDAHTHSYITTGLAENKFGIALDRLDAAVDLARSLPGVNLMGLHFHIGSQITEFESYRLLCLRINDLTSRFASRGIRFRVINVGGGLGIDYDNPDQHPIPTFGSYFRVFKEHLHLDPDQELHFELGRSIVAQCGSLISRVLYTKEGVSRRFAIIDAGMTDLIRPALYGASHAIRSLTSPADAPTYRYDVVGPVCESSDTFARDIPLPELHRGDIIAILSAGAYGEAMASRYNLRELPGAEFSENINLTNL